MRLLSVLLREMKGIEPRIRTFDPRSEFDVTRAEAFLLIGDKVMNNTPPLEFQEHQLDRRGVVHPDGGAVFATWMCRQDCSEEAKDRVRLIATSWTGPADATANGSTSSPSSIPNDSSGIRRTAAATSRTC